MRPAPRSTVVAILLSCLAASGARAQWSPDGVVICDAPKSQVQVSMVSDGSSGAILAWQDGRNTIFPDYDIYAQHLLASGVVDPAWPAQGLAVCTATKKQLMPLLAPDGAGGAFVVWADFRSTTSQSFGPLLYAQHVSAAGAMGSRSRPCPPTTGSTSMYRATVRAARSSDGSATRLPPHSCPSPRSV